MDPRFETANLNGDNGLCPPVLQIARDRLPAAIVDFNSVLFGG